MALRREKVATAATPIAPRFAVAAPDLTTETGFQFALSPLEDFQGGAAHLGVVTLPEDADGTFRGARLAFEHQGSRYPTLGVAAYLQAVDAKAIEAAGDHSVRIGERVVPLSRDGRLLNWWYGRGGVRGAFRHLSIYELLLAVQETREGKPSPLLAELKDKVVFVGASATGLLDFKNTPFTSIEPYPAMEIHATTASNLLQGDFLRDLPRWATALFAFLLSLAAALLFADPDAPARGTAATALLGLAWLLLSALLFRVFGLWLEVVAPVAALATTGGASALWNWATQGRARRETKLVFSRYLSPDVIEELLLDPSKVDLGGKEIEGTVFFSDVKDFTTRELAAERGTELSALVKKSYDATGQRFEERFAKRAK